MRAGPTVFITVPSPGRAMLDETVASGQTLPLGLIDTFSSILVARSPPGVLMSSSVEPALLPRMDALPVADGVNNDFPLFYVSFIRTRCNGDYVDFGSSKQVQSVLDTKLGKDLATRLSRPPTMCIQINPVESRVGHAQVIGKRRLFLENVFNRLHIRACDIGDFESS